MSAWRTLRDPGRPAFVRCEALHAVGGVAHAFSTRRGSVEADVDFGAAGAEGERRRLCDASGLRGPVRMLRQVHGAAVHSAAGLAADEHVEGDGLVAERQASLEGCVGVKTADCVPVLIAERSGGAVAAVHAGWRGVAQGVVHEAVRHLARLGAQATDLVVALGPGIGRCCYVVGEDVAHVVERACGRRVVLTGPGLRLDLHGALRAQLESAGVAPPAIHAAPWCTHCAAELFFSYRREGAGCGRQLSCIGWTSAAA